MSQTPPGLTAGVMIGASAAERALEKDFPKGEKHDIKEMVKRAMELSLDETICFMCINDDEKFKIGVGALLLYFKDDYEFTARVNHEMRLLAGLSAAMSGVPVDFAALAGSDDDEDTKPEALGLLGVFKEVKGL
jgi:hypothetical protein